MDPLHPKRSLLNPRFEGYRLGDPLEDPVTVAHMEERLSFQPLVMRDACVYYVAQRGIMAAHLVDHAWKVVCVFEGLFACLTALQGNQLLVYDGIWGLMILFHENLTRKAAVMAQFSLQLPDALRDAIPITVMDAVSVSEGSIKALMLFKKSMDGSPFPAKTVYFISCIAFSWNSLGTGEISFDYVISIADIPRFICLNPSGDGDAVVGSRDRLVPMIIQPTRDQRLSRSIYRWTQTDEDVRMEFLVKPIITMNDVTWSCSSNWMSLSIRDVESPAYDKETLYGSIDGSASRFTLQNGILEVTLVKNDPADETWPRVFLHDSEDGDAMVDTPEDTRGHFSASHVALEQPVGEEMEEEDFEGVAVHFTFISKSGIVSERTEPGHEWICNALPCALAGPKTSSTLFCSRHGVDAIIWEVSFRQPWSFEHIATFDAFGYVQASKRDRRLLGFDPVSLELMAFAESKRRVYLYYCQQGSDRRSQAQLHGQQWVIELGREKAEWIVGMGMLGKGLVILTDQSISYIPEIRK